MPDSPLLDFLHSFCSLNQSLTSDRQQVFENPEDLGTYVTFFPTTRQINIHADEFLHSREAMINFLLQKKAVSALTSNECEKNLVLSFSWYKYFGRPVKDSAHVVRDSLFDDIVEIGLTRQQISSLKLTRIGDFKSIASETLGRASRSEIIKRNSVLELIDGVLQYELSAYFRTGRTYTSDSPDLPPLASLQPRYRMPPYLRGYGAANVALDQLREAEHLIKEKDAQLNKFLEASEQLLMRVEQLSSTPGLRLIGVFRRWVGHKPKS